MRGTILMGIAAVGLVAGLGACAADGGCCTGCGGSAVAPPPQAQPAPARAATAYRCPHDGATRAEPGPCPKCGMALDARHRASP